MKKRFLKFISVLLILCFFPQSILASVTGYVEPVDMERIWAEPDEVSNAMKDNVLLFINNSRARVGDEVKYINEENYKAAPFYLNSTIMVPLDFISENLGAVLTYNNDNIIVKKDEHTLEFSIGVKEYKKDGAAKTLSEAPLKKDGIIYVPHQALAEGLGTKAFWDKVGFVGVGDTVDKFDASTTKGRNILFEAIEPAILDAPTATQIIADFEKTSKGVHPRIMLNDARIEEIKNQIETDEIMKKWFELLIATADAQVKKPLVKFEVYDGLRATAHSQEAQWIILTCGLAYHLTGKDEYKQRAIDELINVSELPDWNPSHFLDVGEMCAGVGIGYDWLYNEMTEEERVIVENGIVENGLKPGLEELDPDSEASKSGFRFCHKYGTDNKSINPNYVQNWAAVCLGGLAMGALAVGDVDSDIMGEFLSKSYQSLSDLIFKYGFDGACTEGSMYWRYANVYLGYFSSGLNSALGTDYGLFDLPGFVNSMSFEENMTAPTGVLNFESVLEGESQNPYFMLWAAKRFNKPVLLNQYLNRPFKNRDVKNSLASPLVLVWYSPEWYDPSYTVKREELYMREMEYATMSTQGYGENDMFVALKGKNATGTAFQTDGGSFILDSLGVRWSRDPGKSLENYYTNQSMSRTAYYTHRAEGHSTIVINPHYGSQQAHARAAVMEKTQWGTTKRFAITDMTELYEFVGVNSAKRGVMLDTARQYVTLRDEVKSDEPMNFYWFMQLRAEIGVEISEDGKTAVLYCDGKKLSAQILSEGDYKFEVRLATNLPESPQPADMVSQGRAKRLSIHTEGLTEINLTVGFTTLAGEQKISDYTPEIIPLDEWEVDDEKLVMPELTGIYADGELLEDFSPDKYAYDYNFDTETPIPQFTATCSEDYKVEITQPVDEGKGGGVGKITVINKNNEDERRIYYIIISKPALNPAKPSPGETIYDFKTITEEQIKAMKNSSELEILNEKQQGSYTWSIDENGLKLQVGADSNLLDNNYSNIFRWNYSGDYTAITCVNVSASGTESDSWRLETGFVIYADKNNYLTFGVGAQFGKCIVSAFTDDGVYKRGDSSGALSQDVKFKAAPDKVWLKIEEKDGVYTCSYSLDGKVYETVFNQEFADVAPIGIYSGSNGWVANINGIYEFLKITKHGTNVTIKNDGKISANIVPSYETTGTVVFAIYDADGRMINCEIQKDVSLTVGDNNFTTNTLTATDSNNIKVMLWDWDTLTPLCELGEL